MYRYKKKNKKPQQYLNSKEENPIVYIGFTYSDLKELINETLQELSVAGNAPF